MDLFDEIEKLKGVQVKSLDFSGMSLSPSAEQTNELIDKTTDVHTSVQELGESSRRLESLTQALIEGTANVHSEVALLSSSSDKLEHLTKTLKNLTWALIVLTFLAAAVPIGIEVWKVFHEPQIELTPVNPQP